MRIYTVKELVNDYNIGDWNSWGWFKKQGLIEKYFNTNISGKRIYITNTPEEVKKTYCHLYAYHYYPAVRLKRDANPVDVEKRMLKKYNLL